MALFRQAMELYPYVFHPITVLGVGFLVLVHYEWASQDADRSVLWHRVGAFLGAGVLSLVPTVAYVVATGSDPLGVTKGNAWQVDALVASGLFIAAGVTWYLWRRFDWGSLVPGMAQALVAVTIPYVALSPFWNVSGHVIVALLPTLYLTLVDHRFWPSLVVPAIMVPNRIIVEAHTWGQTLAAVPLTAVIVVAIYWLNAGGSLRPTPGSSTS